MFGDRKLIWLGLTPEPERELPLAVAVLRARTSGSDSVASLTRAEQRRIEGLVLHGTQRRWLRYLGEVAELVVAAVSDPTSADAEAVLTAAEVVLDHHRMLIGLPGPGYVRAGAVRSVLDEAVRTLRGGT